MEPKPRPIDCEHVKTKRKRNGIYKIYPKHSVIGFDVYCDFEIDNTGWTVIQRRFNGKTDFYRGWETYEIGFGNLEAEFWLGNQNIHTITKQGNYELRVDISDFIGAKAYARYSTFSVGDASTNYRLNVGGYSGNAEVAVEVDIVSVVVEVVEVVVVVDELVAVVVEVVAVEIEEVVNIVVVAVVAVVVVVVVVVVAVEEVAFVVEIASVIIEVIAVIVVVVAIVIVVLAVVVEVVAVIVVVVSVLVEVLAVLIEVEAVVVVVLAVVVIVV
ncbi:Hypothetical predicted protein [Mytilus galloprovincialis]|uniref:Fibrinogen C-terminal domain-containing protein n=1 Tax=Mytilus galloprovincialis TaxID=29158 RepID=A0A8B6DX39_MYTGA|nr:Hypothetical predicted protein [Mytilus galloprovincialis]